MRTLRIAWAAAVLLVGAVLAISFASSAFLFFKEQSANSRSFELHQNFLESAVAKHVSVVMPIDTINSAASEFATSFRVAPLRSVLQIHRLKFLPSSGFPEIEGSFVLESELSVVPSIQGTFSAQVEITKGDREAKLGIAFLDIDKLRIGAEGFDTPIPRLVSRIISAAGLVFAADGVISFDPTFELSQDVSATIPNFSKRIGGSGVTFGFSMKPVSLKAAVGDAQIVGDGAVILALASIDNGG
ncbi:hypothetical protein NKH73_27885 [Mesorhizobium sp. M0938]|uniref:hypothetical protein n=1 Tax=unclassified Mesorhizobium TaxID=325217 RepID=UPI003335370D